MKSGLPARVARNDGFGSSLPSDLAEAFRALGFKAVKTSNYVSFRLIFLQADFPSGYFSSRLRLIASAKPVKRTGCRQVAERHCLRLWVHLVLPALPELPVGCLLPQPELLLLLRVA